MDESENDRSRSAVAIRAGKKQSHANSLDIANLTHRSNWTKVRGGFFFQTKLPADN